MKQLLTILVFVSFSFVAKGQSPFGFNYQAVIRDAQGSILSEQEVGMQVSIFEAADTFNASYVETFFVSTNQFGLINIKIGHGIPVFGEFEQINWGKDRHFVEIAVDPEGGFNYSVIAKSELMSVPYAMHARTVEIDSVDDADADPTNELQNLSINGNTLSISGGNSITLPLSSEDGICQQLSLVDNCLNISGGNSIRLPYISIEKDADPTNEIQRLSLSNDTLILSGGGEVRLPQETDPTFTAWDRSSGITITTSQITDLNLSMSNPETFEKELGEGENSIDVGFVLRSASVVYFNGSLLNNEDWTGVGSSTLVLEIDAYEYDKIKVIK